MRRISASQATPGMVLLRSIYDSRGYIIFKEGSRLSQESLKKLNIYGVAELVIEDSRVSDIPVQQLIAPELEAEAVQALRQLLTEHQGNTRIDPVLLDELENVGSQNGSEADPKLHALYGAEIISGYQRFEPEGGDF